jgi:hypothetical protein
MRKKKRTEHNKGCGCLVFCIVAYVALSAGYGAYTGVMDFRRAREARAFRAQWSGFFDPYAAARTHLSEGDYLAALPAAEQAITFAQEAQGLEPAYRARAFALKADVHIGLWQYVDAEAALLQAVEHVTGTQRDTLNRVLDEVRGRITDNDTERDEQQIYHAAPGVGPSRTLHGKVVIAYVFVDDGQHSVWSMLDQQLILTHLERTKQWLRDQARAYGTAEPTFVDRVFQYNKDPWLRNAVPQVDIDRAQAGYDLAKRAAELQGAPSVNAFLGRLAREEGADQAVMLLHLNVKARSFAHRCQERCSGEAEYAFLLRESARHHWDAIAYVQAHEALHLFGADDLYNLRGGRNYAPRDVMHHYSRYIEAAVVDSLTAYSIGWVTRLPATPFPVQNVGILP